MKTFAQLLQDTRQLASHHAVSDLVEPTPDDCVAVLEYVDAVCQSVLLRHGVSRFNRRTEYIRTADDAWNALNQELADVAVA